MPELSKALIKEQNEDFQKCLEDDVTFRIKDDGIPAGNKNALKLIHGFAFSLGLWLSKLDESSDTGYPYLLELRSDSILLIQLVVFGNRRSFRLHERSLIENFLRYIYYHHHPIEHQLLQIDPKSDETIDNLMGWTKRHPRFQTERLATDSCCAILSSLYAEFSKSVHGATIKEMELVDAIESLHNNSLIPEQEKSKLRSLFESVTLLLGLFHKETLNQFDLNERALISQFLKNDQKRILFGISTS